MTYDVTDRIFHTVQSNLQELTWLKGTLLQLHRQTDATDTSGLPLERHNLNLTRIGMPAIIPSMCDVWPD